MSLVTHIVPGGLRYVSRSQRPEELQLAECLAEAYRDSGLSASYLLALADRRQPRKPTKEDQEQLKRLSGTLAVDCIGK